MQKIRLNKQEILIKFILTIIVGAALAFSCLFSQTIEKALGIGVTQKSGNFVSTSVVEENNLKIHYINVGQADSTFIELPDGTTMLIDAGTAAAADTIVKYIKALGYESTDQITYLVLTHCDADHVGGAVKVLSSFEFVNIYRPFQLAGTYAEDLAKNLENFTCEDYEDLGGFFDYIKVNNANYAKYVNRVDTATYRNTIKAVYQETYSSGEGNTSLANVTVSYDGYKIESVDNNYNFVIQFYAPLTYGSTEGTKINLTASGFSTRTQGYAINVSYNSYNNVNYLCPLINLMYGNSKFVFSGDMTDTAEEEVVSSLSSTELEELSNVTVFQAGHHGASNANSQNLLNLLSPTYTVVSCGLNNKYGHPTSDFLTRLQKTNPTVTDYLLRTDLQGNIIFGTNGNGVVYAANVEIESTTFEVAWWQIAVGIFIVITIFIWCIKFSKKHGKTTISKSSARRAYTRARRVYTSSKSSTR